MLIRHSRRRENPEKEWGATTGSESKSWVAWLLMVCLLLLTGAGLALWLLRNGEEHRVTEAGPITDGDAMREGLAAAEAVARAFLKEDDPAKRLQWVCNADDVKERMAEYPEEARSEAGEIEKVLGHQVDGGRTVTGFVVAFPSGNARLLEVVGTPDGPRVDWDAYARHGTASWEDMLTGKAQRAVVRVFCEPSSERPVPYEDQGKWTSFRLSSPDLPQARLAFAAMGAVREEKMKKVILSTPKYRQRFTLEIVRHEGEDEPLFEITRCLAVGWILSERAVEEEWVHE